MNRHRKVDQSINQSIDRTVSLWGNLKLNSKYVPRWPGQNPFGVREAAFPVAFVDSKKVDQPRWPTSMSNIKHTIPPPLYALCNTWNSWKPLVPIVLVLKWNVGCSASDESANLKRATRNGQELHTMDTTGKEWNLSPIFAPLWDGTIIITVPCIPAATHSFPTPISHSQGNSKIILNEMVCSFNQHTDIESQSAQDPTNDNQSINQSINRSSGIIAQHPQQYMHIVFPAYKTASLPLETDVKIE